MLLVKQRGICYTVFISAQRDDKGGFGMGDANTVDIHGPVDPNGSEGRSPETACIRQALLPTGYSEREYFIQREEQDYGKGKTDSGQGLYHLSD